MEEHQKVYYEGFAWANEMAKRGYVVLVPDAFTFASRRVMLQDVPEPMRQELTDQNPEEPDNIKKYKEWAAEPVIPEFPGNLIRWVVREHTSSR